MKKTPMLKKFLCTILTALTMNAALLPSFTVLAEGEGTPSVTVPGNGGNETEPTSTEIAEAGPGSPSFSVVPDDPDDNIITLNEAYEDLLNENLGDAPRVTGTSYILYDCESDTILMGRDIRTPLEPASVTKVMTVILALENLDPDETFMVTWDMYGNIPEDYQKLGITSGEEVKVKDMIYAAMLQSANDAAEALAVHMSGSEREFVNQMNIKAAELGCTSTHFTTPYGLADPMNTTSAYDMALIFREAISIPQFCTIATTYQYTMEPTNLYSASRDITNLNRFIATQEFAYDYYIGGKTGYTETAGYTLVAGAKKNDRTLIGVILGSTNSDIRYSDMIKLFDYGYTGFSTVRVDSAEFTTLYKETVDQINSKLIDTNLKVMDSRLELADYLTTTTARLQLGSSNSVELSNVLINTSLEDQEFYVPLFKRYGDGKTYVVGSIYIHISTKDKIIELVPEKQSVWTSIKKILIAAIAITVLILILLYSLVIFRRKLKKRAEEEYRNRSRML